MLKDQLTIIVPTYERHRLILRCIDYFKQLNVQVIIVDSSNEAISFNFPSGCKYLHFPGDSFGSKLYKALLTVETKYSCMCADDDFISEHGLSKGIEFLEKNLDYVSVQGQCIDFSYKNGSISSGPIYTRVLGYTVNSDDRLERVKQAFKPYMHHFYSVHRTPVLQKSLQVVSNIQAVTPVEIAVPLVGVTYGKHLMLPVFWAARDSKTYTHTYTDNTNSLVENNNKKSEITKNTSMLVRDWDTYLSSEDGCLFKKNYCSVINDEVEGRQDQETLFNTAFSIYTSGFSSKTLNTKSGIKSKIKKLLPLWIINLYLSLRYSRLMYYRFPGYPWSNKQSAEDWKKMKVTILKFSDLTISIL